MSDNAPIVHVTTVHPRTDVRIFEKECRACADSGLAPVVLLVADGLGDAECDGIAIRDLGRLPDGRFARMLAGWVRMLAPIRQLRPALVHIHDPELLPLAFVLRLGRRRVVYDAHEDLPHQVLDKHWLPKPLRRPVAIMVSVAEALAGRCLSGVIAATEPIARRFPPARTALVRNFPRLEEFADVGSNPDAARSGFAYVGVIARTRGAEVMLQALEQLPGAQLHLAGNYSPPGLRDALACQPAWSRVVEHGWLDRDGIVALLSRIQAGLVVLHATPSYVEALPVKLFEYMAAGVPVIASDFPRWRQIIDGCRCGLLVDPDDPRALREVMAWIGDHPEEARRMGENGRRAVESRYNFETEARELLAFYGRLGLAEPRQVTS